jgi:putative oxidoreductase
VGTSLAQTMQERRDQFHTLRLGESLDAFKAAVVSFLAGGSYGRFQRRNDEKAENEASVMENDINDGVILAARLLLAALFLIFGWRKLTDYSGTVSRMVQDGARIPVPATVVAIFMELPVAFAVAVGAFARASAVLLALYTLGTSLIAHHYWTVTGANKIDSMESFYKNLSIMGGFLLLYIAGAGKYSIDAILGL